MFQLYEAYYKEEDSIDGGDRRGQSHQHQGGVRKPGHEDGDGNPDAEGGGNSLKHYGDAPSPSVEIADAAEQHTGQDTVCGETSQIIGALGDYLTVVGEGRGEESAAKESCEKDDYAGSAPGGHGSEKSFPCPLFLSGTGILCDKGGYALHDRGGHQQDKGDDLLGDPVSC